MKYAQDVHGVRIYRSWVSILWKVFSRRVDQEWWPSRWWLEMAATWFCASFTDLWQFPDTHGHKTHEFFHSQHTYICYLGLNCLWSFSPLIMKNTVLSAQDLHSNGKNALRTVWPSSSLTIGSADEITGFFWVLQWMVTEWWSWI